MPTPKANIVWRSGRRRSRNVSSAPEMPNAAIKRIASGPMGQGHALPPRTSAGSVATFSAPRYNHTPMIRKNAKATHRNAIRYFLSIDMNVSPFPFHDHCPLAFPPVYLSRLRKHLRGPRKELEMSPPASTREAIVALLDALPDESLPLVEQ